MAELNALPAAAFVGKIGGVFENSPWIAAAAAAQRPFADAGALLAAMNTIVAASGAEKQLALIQAHPDLAGRLEGLTTESAGEQQAAGFSHADATTLGEIAALNAAYRERFGFPFIICARANNVATIVLAMRQRVNHTREEELAGALAEISKIAQLRLADIVGD